MTVFEAFITAPGRVADLEQFSGPTAGTLDAISPPFPGGREVFFAIRDAVQSGRLRGIQVDWGSWAAAMTPAEIAEFLDGLFEPPGDYEARHAGPMEHLAERMRALRVFVDGLPDDRTFAVVAEEL